jgi:hypothetical protein
MAQDKGALHKSKENPSTDIVALHKSKENPSMDIVDEETSIDEIK